MNPDHLQKMQNQFDGLAEQHPVKPKIEFCFAREPQEPLGYARWDHFLTAIQRAIVSCEPTGYAMEHHFRGVTKMVALGSGTSDKGISTRVLGRN